MAATYPPGPAPRTRTLKWVTPLSLGVVRADDQGREVRPLTWAPVTLYAAYGTNLDPARMSERCPHSPLRTTGWLQGWRLTFGGEEHGWDGALSTIVEDPIDQVFVAVYDITREDESNLDGWEAADLGLYRKTKVRVATMNGEIVVWTYVLDAYEGGLPSASYLGVLADAAEAADAPVDYVAALRRRPCRSIGH
nr:gamma-glutamylcyclotransferase [Nocardioides luti]